MKYEEFKERILSAVQEHYGNTVKVTIEKVIKNNNHSYEGIKIVKHPQDRIVPLINLNQVYEKYCDEQLSLQQCVEQICSLRQEEESGELMQSFIHKLTNWEEIKEHIYPMLIVTNRNKQLLESLVSTPYLDLSIIYSIRKTSKEYGQYSIKINHSMMKNYGISTQMLHEQAIRNLKKETYEFTHIRKIIGNLMEGMEFADDVSMENQYPELYVLTTASRIHGVNGILDKDTLKQLAGNRNYYVILSCVHEAVFVPDCGETDKDWLNEQIRAVINQAIEDEEQLSDHYYYHGATGEISVGM